MKSELNGVFHPIFYSFDSRNPFFTGYLPVLFPGVDHRQDPRPIGGPAGIGLSVRVYKEAGS